MERIKLHHIGCAVKNIDIAKEYYMKILGYEFCCNINDEELNLRACFLRQEGHYVELLESIDKEKKSQLDKIIQNIGGGVYHQCYKVENIEETIKTLSRKKFVPYKKIYKENDFFKYIYMITPDSYLIEIIEIKQAF